MRKREPAPVTRESVAGYASYAVGSCYGDWHPAVDREYEAVLRDDAIYAEWLTRMLDYEAQMSEHGYGESNGTPLATPAEELEGDQG